MNVLESGGQKLIQKQQQVASLRKQLKSREDTITDKVLHCRRAVFVACWCYMQLYVHVFAGRPY